MAKKPAAKAAKVSAVAVLVTTMADFTALSSDDRQVRFAEKAQVNRTTFSEMGKLHFLITEDLAEWNAANAKLPKKKQQAKRTIYDELRKRGVGDKSISNASYASRAWRELVAPGHITEPQYDTLTFADCFAICRSLSERSALQLDGAAVGELITKQPDDFDAELNSLYEHGLTVGEKRAQDEQAEADRQAERQRQQKAQVDAAVEAERRKNEAEKGSGTPTSTTDTETETAATTGESADTATETAATTEETDATGAPETDTDTGGEGEDEEAAAEVAEHGTSGGGSVGEQTSTQPQAEANSDANLPLMLSILDDTVKESAGFSAGAQAALIAKLDEVRAAIAARLTPTNVTAIDDHDRAQAA
ncbi:MAG: hypothetical protein QOE70_394 [Chthoniobacter sp.]|jgi:hypothetical protein|nr:hypothetical protein [Chthoniobacter sp.]